MERVAFFLNALLECPAQVLRWFLDLWFLLSSGNFLLGCCIYFVVTLRATFRQRHAETEGAIQRLMYHQGVQDEEIQKLRKSIELAENDQRMATGHTTERIHDANNRTMHELNALHTKNQVLTQKVAELETSMTLCLCHFFEWEFRSEIISNHSEMLLQLSDAALNDRCHQFMDKCGGNVDYALGEAAFIGAPAAVLDSLIKDFGAMVNNKDEDGCAPLHHAARNGHLAATQHLVVRGAQVNSEDNDGNTPLHRASGSGHLDVIRTLLLKGADMNAIDNDGDSPLHYASYNGHLEVVRHFVDHGADVHGRTRDGTTPLHYATSSGRLEVIRYLLDRDASINATDNDGDSPLHCASSDGRLEVVRHLLNRGANLHAKTNDGDSPLHRAAGNGHAEVVLHLIERGADLQATDAAGCTALDYAVHCSKEHIVSLLKSRGSA